MCLNGMLKQLRLKRLLNHLDVLKCDWLDDLLTAVFISHTRILMSIGPNQNYNKINVTIHPKQPRLFIKRILILLVKSMEKSVFI